MLYSYYAAYDKNIVMQCNWSSESHVCAHLMIFYKLVANNK